MSATHTLGLLEDSRWYERIFDGDWRTATGGTSAVREPANGNSLGVVGVGNADDIARATETAAQAKKAWAAVPHRERSAIFLKAAEALRTHF